jgi:hypothetical protein
MLWKPRNFVALLIATMACWIEREAAGGRRGTHMANLWNSRGSLRNLLLPLVSCCECIHSVLNALGKDGSAFYRCR